MRFAVEGIVDSDGDIPFTELPRLGGAGLLRGYRSGTFRDRTLGIATLEYRYPIHANLAGELFVEAGKVARSIPVLTNGDDWHVGYGGGLIVHTRTGVKFRIDLAYGDDLQLYFSTDVLDAFRKREREL
jgi:outer membrane protein assembly factor BamA